MWVDRIVLFAAGALMIFTQGITANSIVSIIFAFTASCFCGYFYRKIPVAIITVLFFVAALFLPMVSYFWPLMIYEVTSQRLYPLYALPIINFIISSSMFSSLTLTILVFSIALALVLFIKQQKLSNTLHQIISIQDSSRESELMLTLKNKQLEKDQLADIEIATLRERGRIAREIHDNVGHILARAILQTGATTATTSDLDTKQSLEALNGTLTQAMQSIRYSVHDLRDDSFSLRATVESCMHDFPQYSYSFHYGMPKNTPNHVLYCFAAIIKEAFFNTSKHSNATRITIDLQEHPAFYKLQFSDNGTKKPTPTTDGMGLENMRERAKALGGTFSVHQERGFTIHVIIPREEL